VRATHVKAAGLPILRHPPFCSEVPLALRQYTTFLEPCFCTSRRPALYPSRFTLFSTSSSSPAINPHSQSKLRPSRHARKHIREHQSSPLPLATFTKAVLSSSLSSILELRRSNLGSLEYRFGLLINDNRWSLRSHSPQPLPFLLCRNAFISLKIFFRHISLSTWAIVGHKVCLQWHRVIIKLSTIDRGGHCLRRGINCSEPHKLPIAHERVDLSSHNYILYASPTL